MRTAVLFVFTEEDAKLLWLVTAAHLRPLMKYGLAHASLSIVRGAITETDPLSCAGYPVRGSMI